MRYRLRLFRSLRSRCNIAIIRVKEAAKDYWEVLHAYTSWISTKNSVNLHTVVLGSFTRVHMQVDEQALRIRRITHSNSMQ